MKTFGKGKATADWIHRTCSFAATDEDAIEHLSSPQMRMLQQALYLMGQVARDTGWTEAHDKSGRLKRAIEDLLHVTRVRRPKGV